MSGQKTNAMRLLDKAGLPYATHSYDAGDGRIDGLAVAEKLGAPAERVYKTLVTQGASGEYHVFIIPVTAELDLKAAAREAGEKSIEMIRSADLLKVTGYVRGGCSPVGMKKLYPTIIDSACGSLDAIIVSAGKIGQQIELSPADLLQMVRGRTAPVSL